MSSGMNMAEAEEIAKKMTYRDAVYNALRGRCVPYKKATRIKLKELLEMLEKQGKWIEDDEEMEIYCSVCGEISDCNYYTNYCPNCGAKMEKIESEVEE